MMFFTIPCVILTFFAFSAVGLSLKRGEIKPQLTFVATVDGKSFLVDSEKRRTWTEASEFCSSVGLKQATITSANQFEALNNASAAEFNTGYGFWTAGRDSQEITQFKWNTTEAELSSEYLPFREIFDIDYETCVGFSKSSSNESALFLHKCSSTFGTLCET